MIDNKDNGLQYKYFVLKPRGSDMYARASRRAMRTYARFISIENPKLAVDLNEWADKEWADAADEIMEHEQ
jgi:hypothetical protein